MIDYDVPYECACCGKKTTNYLCGSCTTSHKGMKEIESLRTRLSLAEKVVEAANDFIEHTICSCLIDTKAGEICESCRREKVLRDVLAAYSAATKEGGL